MTFKANNLFKTLAVLTAIASAQTAMAADGTITFNGQVSATTCTISSGGGATGTNNMTVGLPSVSSSALTSSGATAGRTPFSIVLSGCSGSATQVSTFFENGSLVDQANGQLILSSGSTATKVEIALLNDSEEQIIVGSPMGTQKSQTVVLNSGGVTALNYYAEYIATGQATPGSVNSQVSYSLTYQ